MSELTVNMIRCTDEVMENEQYEPILGGIDLENPPDWQGYLDYFIPEVHPRLELLKQYVIDNGLLGSTGEAMNDHAFKFSDGIIYGFTWRAWGDFMQAVVNKQEGYMTYYIKY